MLVRWYQVGAFAPFFRAHAHIDTKRREPYLLEEPYKSIVRDVLRLRYSLLPVWYTAFREASVTGIPVLRPQFVMFPTDEPGFSVDDQYYIGSSGLLVKPVTAKDVRDASIYLADNQPYYDYFSNHLYRGGRKSIHVKADLHEIPLFIRGGSILSTRERPRRSSPLMKLDPFTIRIALDNAGSARGELYLDDGENYSHEEGNLVWREFSCSNNGKAGSLRITSTDLARARPAEAVDGVSLVQYNPANTYAQSITSVGVEKIVIVGLGVKPKSVKLEGHSKELQWEYASGVSSTGKKEGLATILTIKNPSVAIVSDWTIVVS